MSSATAALPATTPRLSPGATLAGLDPDELAATYGTPFYLYDLDVIEARAGLLRRALPAPVDIAYAVKANPSLAVLTRLGALGLGADVASGGELATALAAGIAADRVVFTGPGKTDAELEAALRAGVRAITVESLDELDSLADRSGLAQPGQGVLLRLAVDGAGEERPIIGGRGSIKFGLLPDELDAAIQRLAGTPYRLLGLHAFGASNVRDPEILAAGVVRLAAAAESLAVRHGLALRLLDGGGGLGIPYADGEAELDVERLGRLLGQEIDSWARRPALAHVNLLLEPGRWLVGPAGVYVVRVVRTKRRGSRTVCVVDGGIHQLARPALIGQQQRVALVGSAAAQRRTAHRVDVVGPLCTGIDVLATDVLLPEPRSTDFLAIADAGAYGFTEAMPLFLSHPQPAELVARGVRVGVARGRIDPADVLDRQADPFGAD
jgi:diaminopimelate decarboxylase